MYKNHIPHLIDNYKNEVNPYSYRKKSYLKLLYTFILLTSYSILLEIYLYQIKVLTINKTIGLSAVSFLGILILVYFVIKQNAKLAKKVNAEILLKKKVKIKSKRWLKNYNLYLRKDKLKILLKNLNSDFIAFIRNEIKLEIDKKHNNLLVRIIKLPIHNIYIAFFSALLFTWITLIDKTTAISLIESLITIGALTYILILYSAYFYYTTIEPSYNSILKEFESDLRDLEFEILQDSKKTNVTIESLINN